MEYKLYKQIYQLVMKIANRTYLKKVQYTDARILLVYFWAVLHDRPICWSCKKSNWPIYLRRDNLPCGSTMSRRLRTQRIQILIKELERAAQSSLPASLCKWIDAKPLPIGRHTKDNYAGFGPAAGLMASGYKLHVIADSRHRFKFRTVRPMNESEPKIACELIAQLNEPGYLVGDRAYDSNKLYNLCGRRNIQLVTQQRRKNARGLGHRRHSPYRIRAMHLKDTTFGQGLIDTRDQIERMFGRLTSFSCGLSPLPNWVRTKRRVEMWVCAKIMIYNIWSQHVSAYSA